MSNATDDGRFSRNGDSCRMEIWMAIVLFAVGLGTGILAVPAIREWSVPSLFLLAQWIIVILVLGALPLLARCKSGTTVDSGELRGLNLPRGSIRAMLALWIVGAYITLLAFAPFLPSAAAGENGTNSTVLETVITAFGPLVGATIAFYFAGRSAAPRPAGKTGEEPGGLPAPETGPVRGDAEPR